MVARLEVAVEEVILVNSFGMGDGCDMAVVMVVKTMEVVMVGESVMMVALERVTY